MVNCEWRIVNSLFTIQHQYCPNVDFKNSRKCKLRCELGAKMSKIDLNSDIPLRHCQSFRGMVHEQWPHDFCSADGPASARRVSPMRRPLRRRLQGAEFLLPGS